MSSSMSLSRQEMFARAPLGVAGAVALQRSVFAQTAEPEYVEVKTAYGRLRGAKTGNLTTFKGIPYAGPVSGASCSAIGAPPQPNWPSPARLICTSRWMPTFINNPNPSMTATMAVPP